MNQEPMKADQIPPASQCYWIRCTRKETGEVWYCNIGQSIEAAETFLDDCRKQWPEIQYELANFVPQKTSEPINMTVEKLGKFYENLYKK